MLRKPRMHIRTLFSGTNLQARTIRGGTWLGLGNGFDQVLRFVRNMLLTRLLAPEALGLMAIVLASNSLLETFTQIGIKESIIQNQRGTEHSYLNCAWWLSTLRSLIVFSIAVISSPWIADFYHDSNLTDLLRVAFLSIIFTGLMSPRTYVALKTMNYSKWVFVYQGSCIAGICTTLFLALILKSVWALVFGFVVESAVRCILSFIICPFRPGLELQRTDVQSLIKYGRGIFGLPILYFIYTQADIFVIGKLCTKEELGFYSMAASLAKVPAEFMGVFVNPLLMPIFSELQDDKERINSVLLRATSLICVLGFPAFMFIIFYSKEVLKFVYGAPYATLSVPFAVLFASSVARTCSAPIAAIYLATGRPHLHRLFTGIRALIMVLGIYPAVLFFGPIGAAAVNLFAMILAYVFQVLQIRSLTILSSLKYLAVFQNPLLYTTPVILAWSVTYILYPVSGLLTISLGAFGLALSISFQLYFLIRNDPMLFADLTAKQRLPTI